MYCRKVSLLAIFQGFFREILSTSQGDKQRKVEKNTRQNIQSFTQIFINMTNKQNLKTTAKEINPSQLRIDRLKNIVKPLSGAKGAKKRLYDQI